MFYVAMQQGCSRGQHVTFTSPGRLHFLCLLRSPMIYQLSDAYSHADIYYCPIIDVYTAYTCGEICSTRVLGIIQLLMHTLHMHVDLCLPFPLGGWIHTIHEQPGRCRGCLVVASADGSPESPPFSSRTAALARASKPVGSPSWASLWLSMDFCLL